jgi:hypothetical protein
MYIYPHNHAHTTRIKKKNTKIWTRQKYNNKESQVDKKRMNEELFYLESNKVCVRERE